MQTSTIVPALRIHAISGETLYPSEGGFSGAWGEVESDSADLSRDLDEALKIGRAVVLRCGPLEVTGELHSREQKGDRCHYNIHIESVRYGSSSK
jgi:hypothetical protein